MTNEVTNSLLVHVHHHWKHASMTVVAIIISIISIMSKGHLQPTASVAVCNNGSSQSRGSKRNPPKAKGKTRPEDDPGKQQRLIRSRGSSQRWS